MNPIPFRELAHHLNVTYQPMRLWNVYGFGMLSL